MSMGLHGIFFQYDLVYVEATRAYRDVCGRTLCAVMGMNVA